MFRLFGALVLCLLPAAALAEMSVTLGAPWDGKRVPKGPHCPKFGGAGATPPMTVTGLPAGTTMVVLSFNDKNYPPLSRNGGHGQIGFPVKGSSADLPAVPGMTDRLSGGARVVARAKSTGAYGSPGYLPPCSGGRGTRYVIDAAGKPLERQRLDIGRS